MSPIITIGWPVERQLLLKGRLYAMDLLESHIINDSGLQLSFMPDGLDEKPLYQADYIDEKRKIPRRWVEGAGTGTTPVPR